MAFFPMKSGYNKGRGNVYKIILNDPNGVREPREYIYNEAKTKQKAIPKVVVTNPVSSNLTNISYLQKESAPQTNFLQDIPNIEANPSTHLSPFSWIDFSLKSICHSTYPKKLNP